MVMVVKYVEPLSSADHQRLEAALLEIKTAEGFGAVNRKTPLPSSWIQNKSRYHTGELSDSGLLFFELNRPSPVCSTRRVSPSIR